MALLRLTLLLGLAAGTLILARSNWQPMQLIFLGLRSPAFPLAIWVLAAMLVGVITTLVVGALLQLTSLAAQRNERQRFRTQPGGQRTSAYSSSQSPTANPVPPRSSWQSPPSPSTYKTEAEDDWEQDATDWFDDEPVDSRREVYESRDRQDPRSRPNYGVRSDDRAPYRPNAEPRDSRTADDRTSNPVVDADYRVIIPPVRNLEDEP